MLYRAVLFTFAPTFIELLFVVGLLANRFSPMVAVLVGCTFALYVAWTLSMTQVCRRVVQRYSRHAVQLYSRYATQLYSRLVLAGVMLTMLHDTYPCCALM